MGFKSFFTSVSKQLDAASEETAQEIAEFVLKKAQGRAPVMGGHSADGVYKSVAKRKPKAPPGTYRKQIQVQYDSNSIVLGVNNMLGAYLEKGTRHAQAYPHIQPAFEENTKEIERIVRDAYERNISK